ncbi:Phosphoenolpyruvate synthase/pyruvate phosphate dikinase [Thermoplasmatales archaeon BRNA1]|nr:Phosphoenolpyruvate synthase/pyruvate phosphate dikinase [Thermoplasmatales archaeon BRNA1]
MASGTPRPVVTLDSSDLGIELVGGKGVNIAKMIANGFSVPPAFAVTVDAYEMFLNRNNLRDDIAAILERTDFDDDASLNSSSEEIRSLFLNANIEDDELIDLKKQRGALEGEYFAVRSSAVAEDLADASFAGQQDTYLNVRRENVVRMILTCWASYWNARAMKYRHDASKDHLSQGMAVVVQRMVNSEISGVMFTADPVTGDDRVIVEASWGLGESIVSGLVTPDHYVLSKPGLEVGEFTVNVKEHGYYLADGEDVMLDIPKEKAEARCADDRILKLIAEQGIALENHFGCPQDIEWAVEAGRVYILQSRNITTLPDKSEKDGILWSRGYGDEYWADATTPMFYTVMGKMLTDYVNHEGAHMMGYKDLESGPLTKLHKSRVYFSATVLERIFAHYPKFIRSRELLEYFPAKEQERISAYGNDYFGTIKSQICLLFRDRDGMIWKTDKVYRRWAQRFMGLCAEFDALDLGSVSDGELADWYERIRTGSTKHYQLIRYGMVSHSIMTNLLVKNWSAKWLHDDGTIYAGLMSAPEDNKTVETNKGFSDMGKSLRENPETREKAESMPAEEFVEWLQSSDSPFREVYNQFIRDFGHRSGTRELNAKRWAEDPEYVIGVALQMCRGDSDLREEFDRSVVRRQETEREVRSRLGFFRRVLLFKVLKYARTYLTFRENQRFYLDHMMYRNRLIFLEEGRRLCERGLIDDNEDIFFLEDTEAIAILRGGDASSARSLIAPRKAEFMKYRDRLPPKFLLDGVDFDDDPVSFGATLVGAASSPGSYRGRVRVIMDVRDLGQVEKGEILVTSNTDPGWTVVFSKLGGLITETGGILCHGAVISREYRIPAVTAVKSATTVLHTGDLVSVDGSKGEVTILEEKE